MKKITINDTTLVFVACGLTFVLAAALHNRNNSIKGLVGVLEKVGTPEWPEIADKLAAINRIK